MSILGIPSKDEIDAILAKLTDEESAVISSALARADQSIADAAGKLQSAAHTEIGDVSTQLESPLLARIDTLTGVIERMVVVMEEIAKKGISVGVGK